jgi:hypothetical protein
MRLACLVLTAALPVALIAAGVRTRRRVLLDMGGLLAAISIVTIRAYFHVVDAWLVLAAAGLGLIVLAMVLRRWLDRAPGKARAGFTAEPLFDSDPGRRTALAVAATVTALSPAARALPRTEPGFEGKGGASGGGGSGGEF